MSYNYDDEIQVIDDRFPKYIDQPEKVAKYDSNQIIEVPNVSINEQSNIQQPPTPSPSSTISNSTGSVPTRRASFLNKLFNREKHESIYKFYTGDVRHKHSLSYIIKDQDKREKFKLIFQYNGAALESIDGNEVFGQIQLDEGNGGLNYNIALFGSHYDGVNFDTLSLVRLDFNSYRINSLDSNGKFCCYDWKALPKGLWRLYLNVEGKDNSQVLADFQIPNRAKKLGTLTFLADLEVNMLNLFILSLGFIIHHHNSKHFLI